MTDRVKPSTETGTSVQIILEAAGKANDYSRLTAHQRRLLLACILAAMVPADGKIRQVETEQLEVLLRGRYGLQQSEIDKAIEFCMDDANRALVQQAARHMVDLLSIEDRITLVGQLWDIALADRELHHAEETLIYELADKFQVPRKRVIEQQARSAGRNPNKT